MPRNGSGSYNLPAPPTPFVNGTTANAPDVNTVLNDIAAAMTDSVAADGQTPMTGALNMNNQNITAANIITAKTLTVGSAVLPLLLRGLLNGLTLSNDAVSPNLILDIAAGTCVDSTNTSFITLAAFTKNISGSWTAGSGSNGMGTGLTATANTWYHVFAILNAGTPDVYFDTSITAANAPAGTTAFRRIGSIRLDASVHILKFLQTGDRFIWGAVQTDVNADTTLTSTWKAYTLAHVPPNVAVLAIIRALAFNLATAAATFIIGDYTEFANTSGLGSNMVAPVANVVALAQLHLVTNTSQQISAFANVVANNSVTIDTEGWVDYLGRFS